MIQRIELSDIRQYLEERIQIFHEVRLRVLKHANARQIMHRTNPYLLPMRQLTSIESLVHFLLDEHLNRLDEDLLGDYLRDIAIFIGQLRYPVALAPYNGIDLYFVAEEQHHLVHIKPSPVWKSTYQHIKLRNQFHIAQENMRDGGIAQSVRCVLGICHGARVYRDRYNYQTLIGQTFWEFLSGNPTLYTEMMPSMLVNLDAHSMEYRNTIAQRVVEITAELRSDFATEGKVDWERVITFCSGKPHS